MPDIAPKDRALSAIGRNLVSFQRLEKMLKGLSGLRPVAGPLRDINRQLEQRRQSTERSTLGPVIPLWLEAAQGREPPELTTTNDQETLVSYSLKLGFSQHVLDEHAKELKELLTERNWLVHQGLAEIDFDSHEACENLLARLDDQERRVTKQIDFLRHIANRLREFREFLDRDDVQEWFRKEMQREITPNDT